MFPSKPSMNWRRQLHEAKIAFRQNQLGRAVQMVRSQSLARYKAGRELIQQLVEELCRRASRCIVAGDLSGAWNQLTAADSISLDDQRNRVQKQREGLIELSRAQAETFLTQGRVSKALEILNELWRRRINDVQADRLANVAASIQRSDKFAADGDFSAARQHLERARASRPDLTFINARMVELDSRQEQANCLTRQLRREILDSNWSQAQDVSGQLLKLAPEFKIAQDAYLRCQNKQSQSGRASSKQQKKDNRVNLSSLNAVHPFRLSKKQAGRSGFAKERPLLNCSQSEPPKRMQNGTTTFLLWLDGIGGFLVCLGEHAVIGQAIEQARVEIPILADLNRRHLRFQQTEKGHLLEPWGTVHVDGKPIDSTIALGKRSRIQLGVGVELDYQRPHPLSQTARLEIPSRHRTQPWSDSIILMNDMLVIGPKRSSHIVCPELDDELVLFKQGEQLMFRNQTDGYEVDQQSRFGKTPIELGSRIVGESFSIMLEEIDPGTI